VAFVEKDIPNANPVTKMSDIDGISWSRNDLEFPGSKNPRISKSQYYEQTTTHS
jgi:hypothetical protein